MYAKCMKLSFLLPKRRQSRNANFNVLMAAPKPAVYYKYVCVCVDGVFVCV